MLNPLTFVHRQTPYTKGQKTSLLLSARRCRTGHHLRQLSFPYGGSCSVPPPSCFLSSKVSFNSAFCLLTCVKRSPPRSWFVYPWFCNLWFFPLCAAVIQVLALFQMASRGRGRGRGRGHGGSAPQLEFVLFPKNVKLPDVKVNDIDDNMKMLLRWSNQHQNYWKVSPYFLEEKTSKESQKMHIARYSDKKKTMFSRDSLSQVLVFNKFATELVQGKSRQMPSKKKFRWNPESGMKRIEFFEQQEKKDQGREDKDEQEKKDEENEDDENAEDDEGEEEEEFGDDDYNQNEYFDDDEDDYNPADDGDDEPTY